MTILVLFVVFGGGLLTGRVWAHRRVTRAYDLGYEEGVRKGFEQIPEVLKQILGARRFREILEEIQVSVDTPESR